jgi:mRNA interferase RelE/StbE
VYQVTLTKAAARELRKLPVEAQRRIATVFNQLSAEPRPPGVEKLTDQGEDFYRVRTGNYRVIYQINDKELVVLIVSVGDRKDIYKRFGQ